MSATAAGTTPPPGDQVRRLELPIGKGAIGQCRAFTSKALADWHPSAAANGSAGSGPGERSSAQQLFVQDVLLMVSEVVTNACIHTSGPVQLQLDRTAERLRIEVTDPSPTPPAPRVPTPGLPGGYGLQVVVRLSRAWGYTPRGDGKVVWFEMTWPADSPGSAGSPS
ncbi:MAG TPA: ATP-binding protein [Actinocrinis sp.]|nr:ATP-binding protein [Actinocrinis sp.]